jgi:hypothetical protein
MTPLGINLPCGFERKNITNLRKVLLSQGVPKMKKWLLTLTLLSSQAFGQEGLQAPTQLYQPVGVYVPPPKLGQHPYLGLGLSFGPSKHSWEGSETSAAFMGGLQLGYIKAIDSWNLILGEIFLITGQLGGNERDLALPFGAIARMGYGYSFTPGFFGVIKGGLGVMNGSYKKPMADKPKELEKKSVFGTLFQMGYGIAYLATPNFMLDTTLFFTYGAAGETARALGLEMGGKFLF